MLSNDLDAVKQDAADMHLLLEQMPGIASEVHAKVYAFLIAFHNVRTGGGGGDR